MFIGRLAELQALAGLWEKSVSSLVTCRGRRRVGKSTLIEEFAKRTADHFLFIEGLAPRRGMSDALQRRNFCERLAEKTGRKVPRCPSWPLAFEELDRALPDRGRTVVLLDEISWMGGYNPDFPGFLKTAWDKLLKKHEHLIFVLCGSVSAWISRNILESTGFVGRNSLDLDVGELPLSEALQILPRSVDRMSAREKFDILSITGGIPKYLEEVRPELSVDENVRRMCFSPLGLLFREFDETFSDVWGGNAERKKQLLGLLATGSKTLYELSAAEQSTANGHLSRALKELEMSGFVARDSGLNPQTGAPIRSEHYRLKDNYVRFYLRFVAPRKKAVEGGLFQFSSLEQLKGWESMLGLQFENLILNHVADLFAEMGLEHSLVLSAAPYVQHATRRGEGCQIDLLIQTQRSLFVVEIKRRVDIGPEIMDEVAEKCRRLKKARGLSVRTALVYEGRLSPRVPAEKYFDFLIPAERLLK